MNIFEVGSPSFVAYWICATIFAMCGLIGTVVLYTEANDYNNRKDARNALKAMGVMLFSWAWPVLFVVGVCGMIGNLLRIADIATPTQALRARKQNREDEEAARKWRTELETRRLERELGIKSLSQ